MKMRQNPTQTRGTNSDLQKANDTGPPELANHFTIKATLISQTSGNASHMRVQDQTEIDRLLLNDWITPAQYSAAESMAQDIHIAGLSGVKAMNYGRVIGRGVEANMTNREALRRLKIQRAIKHLDKFVGKAVRFLVMGVCRDELKLDKFATKKYLTVGLNELEIFLDKYST